MKHITFLLAFAILSTVCMGQTQLSMNEAAAKKVAVADKKLNEVYRQVLKEYGKDAAFLKALKSSQQLWIRFRDAEMAMMYPKRASGYYGSAKPACESTYLATLINERISKLQLWLAGQEEGDSCGSSIKTKR